MTAERASLTRVRVGDLNVNHDQGSIPRLGLLNGFVLGDLPGPYLGFLFALANSAHLFGLRILRQGFFFTPTQKVAAKIFKEKSYTDAFCFKFS